MAIYNLGFGKKGSNLDRFGKTPSDEQINQTGTITGDVSKPPARDVVPWQSNLRSPPASGKWLDFLSSTIDPRNSDRRFFNPVPRQTQPSWYTDQIRNAPGGQWRGALLQDMRGYGIPWGPQYNMGFGRDALGFNSGLGLDPRNRGPQQPVNPRDTGGITKPLPLTGGPQGPRQPPQSGNSGNRLPPVFGPGQNTGTGPTPQGPRADPTYNPYRFTARTDPAAFDAYMRARGITDPGEIEYNRQMYGGDGTSGAMLSLNRGSDGNLYYYGQNGMQRLTMGQTGPAPQGKIGIQNQPSAPVVQTGGGMPSMPMTPPPPPIVPPSGAVQPPMQPQPIPMPRNPFTPPSPPPGPFVPPPGMTGANPGFNTMAPPQPLPDMQPQTPIPMLGGPLPAQQMPTSLSAGVGGMPGQQISMGAAPFAMAPFMMPR